MGLQLVGQQNLPIFVLEYLQIFLFFIFYLFLVISSYAAFENDVVVVVVLSLLKQLAAFWHTVELHAGQEATVLLEDHLRSEFQQKMDSFLLHVFFDALHVLLHVHEVGS